jgi:hypothetical protein
MTSPIPVVDAVSRRRGHRTPERSGRCRPHPRSGRTTCGDDAGRPRRRGDQGGESAWRGRHRGWGPPFVYPVDWIRPQLSVATNCRGPNRRARSATGRRGPAGKARLRCPSQCLAKGVLANFSSITGEKDSSAAMVHKSVHKEHQNGPGEFSEAVSPGSGDGVG